MLGLAAVGCPKRSLPVRRNRGEANAGNDPLGSRNPPENNLKIGYPLSDLLKSTSICRNLIRDRKTTTRPISTLFV